MRRGMLPIDFGDRTSAVGLRGSRRGNVRGIGRWRTWTARTSGLSVRMLGPLAFRRGGTALDCPRRARCGRCSPISRWRRMPVGRSRLCDLLWDVPNDPARRIALVPEQAQEPSSTNPAPSVVTSGDTVSLDLGDCFVDAVEVAAAAQAGIDTLDPDRLQGLGRAVCRRLPGWSGARPQSAVRQLAGRPETPLRRLPHRAARASGGGLPVGSDEALRHLENWAELAPFDARAHMMLLGALAERGQLGDGEQHLAAAERRFAAEELDFAPVREAWAALRGRRAAAPRSALVAPASPHPAAARPCRAAGASRRAAHRLP